jgi:hypothetical protein
LAAALDALKQPAKVVSFLGGNEMAEDDLRATEELLRAYVFEQLLKAPDSPAVIEARKQIRDAFHTELQDIRSGLAAQISAIHHEVVELKEIVKRIPKERLDKKTLKELERRLAGLADDRDTDPGARGSPERRSYHVDGNEEIDAPKRAPWNYLLAMAGLLIAVALIVGWAFTISRETPPFESVSLRPSPAALSAERRRAIDRGWERLISQPSALREELCGQAPECSRDALTSERSARALQGALNMVRDDFACAAEPLGQDGDLEADGPGSLNAIVECAQTAWPRPRRCAELHCEPPTRQGEIAQWRDPLLEWALLMIGLQESA